MDQQPQILFEDNHLLAINKPFGMPSQDDESGDLSAFEWGKAYIKEKYAKPGNVYLGLLHRLDRPAGGVLLMAKTSKAAERMSKMFQNRELEKTYWAITENIPKEKERQLVHHLKKIQDRNIMQAFPTEFTGTQKAVLSYSVLKEIGHRALLEVKLETGRRHQIRVQLAAIRCPIVGDVKYGKNDFLPDLSIALLARKLSFRHPVLKENNVEVVAPVPQIAPWTDFGL